MGILGKLVLIPVIVIVVVSTISAVTTPDTAPAAPESASVNAVVGAQNPATAAALKKYVDAEKERKAEREEAIVYEIASSALENFKLSLRDPDSARFRDVWGIKSATGLIAACGVVNATNGFGGFVGETPFIATSRRALTPAHPTFPKMFEEICIQGKKVMKLYV